MSFLKYFRSSLLGVLIIPTESLKNWTIEQFSKIPKNEISANQEGMQIKVENSASPLIFPLSTDKKVIGFKVKGEFFGLPKFSEVSNQGEKGFDDYVMRIGFVIRGDKKLTGIKRVFAADWVKNLYSLVQDSSGLESVLFFNVTQNEKQLGKQRTHPSTDLFIENFFELVKNPGAFNYEYRLQNQKDVAAIWISVDGDDTKSSFKVLISKLELLTE